MGHAKLGSQRVRCWATVPTLWICLLTTSAACTRGASSAFPPQPSLVLRHPANGLTVPTPITVPLVAELQPATERATIELLVNDRVVRSCTASQACRTSVPVRAGKTRLRARTTVNGRRISTPPTTVIGTETPAEGELSDTDIRPLLVGVAQTVLSVRLVEPSPSSPLTAPTTIHLDVVASGRASEIVRVEFFERNRKIASRSSPPWRTEWRIEKRGEYCVSAVATDKTGKAVRTPWLLIAVD